MDQKFDELESGFNFLERLDAHIDEWDAAMETGDSEMLGLVARRIFSMMRDAADADVNTVLGVIGKTPISQLIGRDTIEIRKELRNG